MDVFTSITLNYLPKARILASSLKSVHPEWTFYLCVSDRKPAGLVIDLAREPFDAIIWIDDLKLEDLYSWIFKHSLVEICTAVKGPVALELLHRGSEKVLYLDPDIAVFNSLVEIEDLLDTYSVILTPHQLDFESETTAIVDNEVCSLKHGAFNLGFFAVNNSAEGLRFAQWFNDRLLEFCYADIPNGLFTDQKWCDLAPCFFDNLYILRDPGCNVASWNLSRRNLSFSNDGTLLANQSPLKFYHFTGYDSGMGDIMTARYGEGNIIVSEIWSWYRLQLQKQEHDALRKTKWFFDSFENGDKIPVAARQLYRQRQDLQEAFPNPFASTPNGGYAAWYRVHGS